MTSNPKIHAATGRVDPGVHARRGAWTRALSSALSLAVALAFATVAHSADAVIVPGERIGAVAVGMSRAQVERLLGKAQTEHAPSPQRTNAVWPLPGKGVLHVQFVDGKAARIGTNAQEYATADGIAVGASPASMRALHPNVTETAYALRRKGGMAARCYDDVAAGVGFEFDKTPAQHDFVLRSIYVHAAGKATPCGREDDPRATKRIGAAASSEAQ